MFTELKEDNLAEVVKSNKVTIVQYSAGWCGNCRMIKPRFKRMANDYEAEFIVVDAEQFPESRQLAHVNNLPTFAAFRGDELLKQIQTNRAESLKEFVDEITSN